MKVFRAAIVAFGVAALCGGSAFAQSGAVGTTEAVKPAKAKKDPSRRVCRNLVMSGSRLSDRVCRTQADWEKSAHDAQDSALQQQTGPGYRPEPSAPTASVPR